jgi:hypothetical protein
MSVIKWRLEDPADPNPDTRSYTFEVNPNSMNSPYPTRSTQTMGTTAVDGNVLMWEGMRQPAQLTFGGVILSHAQYMALYDWVYNRKGRLFLWDHFQRRMTVVLKSFSPEPKSKFNGKYYWRHEYTIEATVLATAAPLYTEDLA